MHLPAELLSHREAVGKRLQEVLDHKTNPWGITVQSVEVRDIIIPRGLEDACRHRRSLSVGPYYP
jgi:regulator of protease activity HflC (stomatin/prohibitin superfamily)